MLMRRTLALVMAAALASSVLGVASPPSFASPFTTRDASGGTARVWVPTGSFDSSSLVRGPQAGDTGAEISGDLALLVPAGSRASAQLAVTAGVELRDLAVAVTELTGPGGTLKDSVEVRYPRYIRDKNTGGTVADPLEKVASVNVAKGMNQPVWLTVQVPSGAAPGTYRANITVATAAGKLGSWPIAVEVPKVKYRPVPERPFVLDLWQHPDAVADHLHLAHWSEEHFQALKPYWADLAAAGQDVLNLAVTEDPWLVEHNGEIRPQTWSHYRSTVEWRWDGTRFTFGFDVFDRLVADARAAGIGDRIHAFAMLQFQKQDRFYYVDTRTGKGVWETYKVGNERYREVWGAFLNAFEAHLKAKGWWDSASLAFDEQPLRRMKSAFAVISKSNPQWNDKIALAANSLTEADIARYISFNLTFLDRVSQKLIDSRRAAGKPTLFYTWNEPAAPNTVVKTPPFNVRALPWIVEQRDLDGYLRWTYQSWPKAVDEDPTFRYGQGDEYIVYPGANGPVSSIRWELFKDGLEDAELLDLAKGRLGKDRDVVAAALSGVQPGGAATDAARRGMLDHRAAVIKALD